MKLKPDWQQLIQKGLPYVLAAVLASATVFTVLGVQSTNVEYLDIQQTKAEMEAEKLTLEANQRELQTALAETQNLISQLATLNADMQGLLEKAKLEEKEVADRIAALQIAVDTAEERQRQKWVLPIQYKVFSSPFGYREHPVAGEGQFHYGVDLAADLGTPIVASRSGTVTSATFENVAGNYVVIDHLDGYTSRYMHMDKYIVTPGQFVMAGQIIGYCGSTGVSTGSHLHFGIYHNDKAVNPALYIDL